MKSSVDFRPPTRGPDALTQEEKRRLLEINKQLEPLGLTISFRDPAYKEFEEWKARQTREGE